MVQQVRFGALLALAASSAPGCTAVETETEDETEEAVDTLDTHDGANSRLTIDEKCEEACRQC
jgi:hypothetical protein